MKWMDVEHYKRWSETEANEGYKYNLAAQKVSNECYKYNPAAQKVSYFQAARWICEPRRWWRPSLIAPPWQPGLQRLCTEITRITQAD